MADVFIDSNAAGANDGTSWTDAYNAGTQADWSSAATDAATAGDRIIVADVNATVCSSNFSVTVNANHTQDDPLKIIVSDVVGSTTVTPVTDYGTSGNGEIDGNASNDIQFNGFAYIHGLRFVNMDSSIWDGGANSCMTYEKCLWDMNKAASAEELRLSNGGKVTLIDTDINMQTQAHSINMTLDAGSIQMIGGSIATDSNVTNIFEVTSARSGHILGTGIDCTSINASTDMVQTGVVEGFNALFEDCNWPATMPTLYGSTVTNLGTFDYIIASGDQHEISAFYRNGTVLHETTIRRADGADTGSQTYSIKFESTSSTRRSNPLRHLLAIANPGDLDTLTIKAHFAQNSGGALDNDEIWIECLTPTSAGVSSDTDRNLLGGTATTHTDESGSVDWRDGAGALTGYNEQSCSVTVSGATAGELYVYLCVNGDFTTTNNLYVDPKLVIA